MDYRKNIANSKLTIYDTINPINNKLFIPTNELERMLSNYMIGRSLEGFALRTRSKVVKNMICQAIGYDVPKSFKKTKPRFPGQNFDVYTQKSLNVQVWNEDIDANRRYVFVRINEHDIITAIKIITGKELVKYDRTGTLTKKYQATMTHLGKNYCSAKDTDNVSNWIKNINNLSKINEKPNSNPTQESLLQINEIYTRLLPLVGQKLDYLNATQERNRGAKLHEIICKNLGYNSYEDDGTYPDIKNQLIEVKLQTSPTIDLGLHSPEERDLIITSNNYSFYSEDIRYVIFDAEITGKLVTLNNLYVISGIEFTSIFPLFKGMGVNAKIQLPLPINFFNN